jgi:hypothetical protein
MGPFDDPAHWQDHKPCIHWCSLLNCLLGVMQCSSPAIAWMANDFNTNMVRLLDVMSAFSTVRTVCVELFEPRALGARLRDHGCGSIPVLYARGSYRDCDEQSHCIDNEMALSPFDFLARVKTAFATLR